MGTAGVEIHFDDDTRTLRYDSNTESVLLGDQAITPTPSSLYLPSTFSIDFLGDEGDPAPIDASSDSFTIVDRASSFTNVVIENFSSDDLIEFIGGDENDFEFAVQDSGADLLISCILSDGNNLVLLDNVLDGTIAVNDYDSAVAGIGFSFMTFA